MKRLLAGCLSMISLLWNYSNNGKFNIVIIFRMKNFGVFLAGVFSFCVMCSVNGFSENRPNHASFGNQKVELTLVNQPAVLWQYSLTETQKRYNFSAPTLEVDGHPVQMLFSNTGIRPSVDSLRNGGIEYILAGSVKYHAELVFRLIFRISGKNAFIRFHYEIYGRSGQRLTKKAGTPICYFRTSFSSFSHFSEVRLSAFNEQSHSYELSETTVPPAYFNDNISFTGPLFTANGSAGSLLIAYEHGSSYPETFLQFKPRADKQLCVESVKGNFYDGQLIDQKNPFQSVWFEAGAVTGGQEMLAREYRSFVLNNLSENLESRKPYIFYNTWNFQERNKHWYKKPYLADMNMERMLKEIDVAHRIGIEVFVIDAGWFEKTGDWSPSKLRFPDGLKRVKAKLDSFGMKLGLWFNPTAAAVSSKILSENRDCVKSSDGRTGEPFEVWETEKSYEMCLVSKYKDAFADELIRLSKELGVSYFKWDAIGQHGCNDPHHMHGSELNSPAEREECFAFELPRAMAYIVNKLGKACPQAIVDFDVTENGRSMGLGFLSAGKYFLMNNGPYYPNYDIPFDWDKANPNIFFQPGPARGWICRSPLTYDKWIPSVLFLTHYLPDDPYENQSMTIGSLILGQNGIWGDLPAISDTGIDFMHLCLSKYKEVRKDMTAQPLLRNGQPGSSPEIYEKINEHTGRGAVVIFATQPGKYTYITQVKPNRHVWHTKGVTIQFDRQGLAVVNAVFDKAEAKIIFFGVHE